ncbi:hypothetical protein LguiB_032897 [Lonicera macranthoides]
MKHRLFCFRGILLILVVFIGLFGAVHNSQVSKLSYTTLLGNGLTVIDRPPARRSLLSDANEHDTALVATLDGTINLLDLKSGKTLWSFASGSSIYSSYQAPVNHGGDEENASDGAGYFIDCGDDWKLYADNGLRKMHLHMTVEEYLRSTPQISDDGVVVLGSKKSTFFLVDAKTGKLLYTHSLFDSPARPWTNIDSSGSHERSIKGWEIPSSVILKTDEMPLYITRTDYLLESFALNSGRVLWNVSVSEIVAAFLCQDIEKSISGDMLNTGRELPSEPPFNMPLPCQSTAVVHRLRSNRMLDSSSRSHMLPGGHHDNLMLHRPSLRDLVGPQDDDAEAQLSLTKNSAKSGVENVEMPDSSVLSSLYYKGPLFIILLIVLGLLIYGFGPLPGKLTKQPSNLDAKAVPSKRKKNRKSGKSNGIFEKNPENGLEGHRIGKLFVSNTEIAKGSNGTVVLEGIYEGRPVAVKRLVRAHHDVAFKEIQNLIASDQHPNIVRWYGVEYDQHFVYLSLERCACSLNDLIQMYSDSCDKPGFTEGQASKAMTEYKIRLDSMKGIMQDVELWKSNGYPSPILLKLMRDLVSGLVHLHELGIIHRDLKPQNVLIIKERTLCAKLSDMGISKRLVGDMASLGHHATGKYSSPVLVMLGYGSSGWQAPEQLLHGRQTRAVDLFSLGCVLFYCVTGGRHPFGDHLERDINIIKNQVDFFLVDHIPEAVDLFSQLLSPHAELRPKAIEVLHHPLFWRSETRLSFLRDTSDRVELEDREGNSDLLKALESVAPIALGGKWDVKMETSLLIDIGRYRQYEFDSVRDLLRVIRNKFNHYRECPQEIQELLGSVPEGFEEYFGSRFPKFLIEVYKVVHNYCKEEEWFNKYINTDVI